MLFSRSLSGSKVIVLPLQEKLPETGFPSLVRLSENAPCTEACFIGSEKVTLTLANPWTPVEPPPGEIDLIVGRVESVVKYQSFWEPSALPARSRAPVVTVAVYLVLARSVAGSKVIVLPFQEKVPETGAPSLVRLSEKALSV